MNRTTVIPSSPAGKAWHGQSAEEVLAHNGSVITGLSAQEAAKRLAEHGPNEMREAAPINPWAIFLGQFKNLIVWILIVAGVVSGVLVAVDVPEPHGFASRYAFGITAPGGTVCHMHNLESVEPADVVSIGTEPASPAAEAGAKLRALTPHEEEARGITTEVEVTTSCETATAICAAAERFGAEIICIGSHTRRSFTAKALGSISLAVLQASRRPVLVVWPPME